MAKIGTVLIVFKNGASCTCSTARKKMYTTNVNKYSLTIWHSVSQELVIENCRKLSIRIFHETRVSKIYFLIWNYFKKRFLQFYIWTILTKDIIFFRIASVFHAFRVLVFSQNLCLITFYDKSFLCINCLFW